MHQSKRERAVADRRAEEIGRGQRLAFGQRFPHHGRAVFGQFDAVGDGPEPFGKLHQCPAFTGARVQDETFARARRPEPFQDGGDGFGGGGVVAAFDLGHEAGHCLRELLGKDRDQYSLGNINTPSTSQSLIDGSGKSV